MKKTGAGKFLVVIHLRVWYDKHTDINDKKADRWDRRCRGKQRIWIADIKIQEFAR